MAMIDNGNRRENYKFPYNIVEHPELAHDNDPFFDPSEHERIMWEMHAAVLKNRQYAEQHPEDPKGQNPALDDLKVQCPQIKLWLDMVQASTSLALDPLYNPGARLLRPAVPLAEELSHWFANLPIGVGVRNRRRLEEELIFQGLDTATDDAPSVLSIPSGNGYASVAAMLRAKADGVFPHLTMVDLDEQSVQRATRTARDGGISPDEFHVISRNAMNPKGFQHGLGSIVTSMMFNHRFALPTGTFTRIPTSSKDIVSCVGFPEYLLADDWQYDTGKKIAGKPVIKTMAGVQTMMQNLFRTVKPGGKLIFGSMNLIDPNHPEAGTQPMVEFAREVIRWRGLRPSTEFGNNGIKDEIGILPIIESAGIDPEVVNVHREPSGIYNLYEIVKR